MKKITKSFIAMALGLSLVLAGCSTDDDDAIKLSDFVGSYTTGVSLIGLGENPIPVTGITLTISESNGALKATADVDASQFGVGVIGIDLKLTDLKSYGTTVLGITAGGYYFKVPEQDVAVGANNFKFKGTGNDEDGYDGNTNIISSVGTSFTFEIAGNVPVGVDETGAPQFAPLTIQVGGQKK